MSSGRANFPLVCEDTMRGKGTISVPVPTVSAQSSQLPCCCLPVLLLDSPGTVSSIKPLVFRRPLLHTYFFPFHSVHGFPIQPYICPGLEAFLGNRIKPAFLLWFVHSLWVPLPLSFISFLHFSHRAKLCLCLLIS